MPKITFVSRLEKLRREYAETYDIESLKSANDKANLEMMLRNQIIIEDMQDKLNEPDKLDDIADVKRINDILRDLISTNLSLEKTLGIDRKSRKTSEDKNNPAEYISNLKRLAREFLEKRLIKVFCEECNVMLLRFAPVHEHTEFEIKIQCSQCKKMIRAIRKERDVFFDIAKNDRQWRAKYPVEIVAARKIKDDLDRLNEIEDDVTIGGSSEE